MFQFHSQNTQRDSRKNIGYPPSQPHTHSNPFQSSNPRTSPPFLPSSNPHHPSSHSSIPPPAPQKNIDSIIKGPSEILSIDTANATLYGVSVLYLRMRRQREAHVCTRIHVTASAPASASASAPTSRGLHLRTYMCICICICISHAHQPIYTCIHTYIFTLYGVPWYRVQSKYNTFKNIHIRITTENPISQSRFSNVARVPS